MNYISSISLGKALIILVSIILLIIYILNVRKSKINKVRKYMFSAGAFILLFMTEIISPTFVVGPSMYPNLNTGDLRFINKLDKNVKPFDIIVFKKRNSKEFLIKRVYGLPGEKLQIKNGKTYINDKLLDDSNINIVPSNVNYGPVYIPNDSYFVMGDNRPISLDSRKSAVGFVTKSSVAGKILK